MVKIKKGTEKKPKKIKKLNPKLKTRKQRKPKKPKKSSETKKVSIDEPIIIKSRTPDEDKDLSKEIYNDLKKSKPKEGKPNKGMEQVVDDTKQLSLIKSFSPAINRQLVSLKSIAPENILGCEDLLQVKIGKKCVGSTSKQAQQKLLHNLRSSKHLDCSRFIAPKQYSSNCWFNTMFVSFFFSDKGRKFFRFLRQLMIVGEKSNGEKIPQELAELFSTFNIIIDTYYNQVNNPNEKLIRNFNTNYFIENLHNILIKKYIRVYKKNESGNPIEYYKNIIKYLNYDVVNIINVELETSASNEVINNKVNREIDFEISKHPNSDTDNTNYPEIIVVEMLDDESKKIANRELKLKLTDKNGNTHNYVLDAVIMRDRDKQHFSSLLTCGGTEFSFDGASYSRLNKFKWTDYLNKKRYWGFEGHDLKWGFMSSYQMLFYYKV
jgi:hypothetical protein